MPELIADLPAVAILLPAASVYFLWALFHWVFRSSDDPPDAEINADRTRESARHSSAAYDAIKSGVAANLPADSSLNSPLKGNVADPLSTERKVTAFADSGAPLAALDTEPAKRINRAPLLHTDRSGSADTSGSASASPLLAPSNTNTQADPCSEDDAIPGVSPAESGTSAPVKEKHQSTTTPADLLTGAGNTAQAPGPIAGSATAMGHAPETPASANHAGERVTTGTHPADSTGAPHKNDDTQSDISSEPVFPKLFPRLSGYQPDKATIGQASHHLPDEKTPASDDRKSSPPTAPLVETLSAPLSGQAAPLAPPSGQASSDATTTVSIQPLTQDTALPDQRTPATSSSAKTNSNDQKNTGKAPIYLAETTTHSSPAATPTDSAPTQVPGQTSTPTGEPERSATNSLEKTDPGTLDRAIENASADSTQNHSTREPEPLAARPTHVSPGDKKPAHATFAKAGDEHAPSHQTQSARYKTAARRKHRSPLEEVQLQLKTDATVWKTAAPTEDQQTPAQAHKKEISAKDDEISRLKAQLQSLTDHARVEKPHAAHDQPMPADGRPPSHDRTGHANAPAADDDRETYKVRLDNALAELEGSARKISRLQAAVNTLQASGVSVSTTTLPDMAGISGRATLLSKVRVVSNA